MNRKLSKKKKAPKISREEQLQILKQETITKWNAEQVALLEKTHTNLKEYNQRRVGLIDTNKFFRRLEKSAAETNRRLAKDQAWQHYRTCKKLPNPACPAELRDFLYQWSYEQEERFKQSTSWTLDVNERCLLTQDETIGRNMWKDQFAKNKNIEQLYLPGIRNALKILFLIENSARKSFSQRDVDKVRDEIRAKITQQLDELTLRVGGNIWRDMTPLDPISAEYMYSSDIIDFCLWSFQNVPLPPEYNYLVKSIEMKTLQVKFFKPPSFDLKDCSLRGMWAQFDHYSDLDSSFRCSVLESVPDLNASQEIEWADRNRLKMQKLQELKSDREKYDTNEKKKELEKLEAVKAAGSSKVTKTPEPRKKPTKKKKAKKVDEPLEAPPPVVTDATVVDIDQQYILQEQQLYEQRMEQIGPRSFNLSEDTVNLRQHTLTGGILSLNCFNKLPQSSQLRCDFIYTTLPTDLKLEEKQFTSDVDSELIKLEIKLPENCFWWHEPVVCRWEAWEESIEFQSLDKQVQDFHRNYETIMDEKSKQLFSAPKRPRNSLRPMIIRDFNVNEIPNDVKLHFLIVDHVLPRLPHRYKTYAELHKLFVQINKQFIQNEKLKLEEMLNQLLFPKFLVLQAANNGDSEEMFRLPSLADIPVGKESMTSLEGSLMNLEIRTPIESMLQEIASKQQAPTNIFPPCKNIPLLVITEDLEPLDLELDDMIQKIQESVIADDEFSADSVYKMFSTFLKLLDRLREREQPQFPEVIEPEEPEPEPEVTRRRTVLKDPTHRHQWNEKFISRMSKRVSSFMMIGKQKPPSRGSAMFGQRKRRRRKSTVQSTASDVSTDEAHKPPEPEPTEFSLLPHEPGRWTTKVVRRQEFDATARVVTVWIEKLGIFGFSMEKYHNLPFKGWDMRRTGKISDFTTTLKLDCVGLRLLINITESGYRIEFQESPQRIKPPPNEMSLEELGKYLTKINLIIFPEPDAPFYITNMTTPKHESMEIHNLKCMAAFCLTHNFSHCFWNKYAPFREALFLTRQMIEDFPEQPFATVMMSPLKAATVTVEELCSPLEEVNLAYHPVPENQPYNPDVYSLLKDKLLEPSRKLFLITPTMLQWNVSQLLLKLRLFSFS
ncbi:uncharacterized protein LOC135698427 [Ochlerotatus camptorhynchus]|uniref:uncharacterized protein LOC135698427 n=1 Tax=Ochlerotatus camptorhynchus TaxID=644619 RepID=UPI0031D0A8B9